ncbi:MAG: hypothetical protein HQL67_09820 [Magnetococcales bacterium]|nr:hypothetical protein [Magnetococcales bacterium]
MGNTENYRRELAFIFFSQKSLILKTAILFFCVTLLIAFFWPPTYSATGSILVKGKKIEKNLEAIEEAQLRPISVTKNDLFSEVAILTSNDVFVAALDTLDKMGKKQILETISKDPDKRVKRLKSKFDAQVVATSNVIDVMFMAGSPKMAQTVLQVIMEQYILHRTKVYNPFEVGTFLTGQVDRYRSGMVDMRKNLENMIEETGAIAPTLQIENNLLIKKDLQTRIDLLGTQLVEKRLMVDLLDKKLQSEEVQFFSFINNQGILMLSAKLLEVVAEQGSVLKRYNPESPAALSMAAQVDKMFTKLRNEVSNYADNLRTEISIIETNISDLTDRLEAIDQQNVQIKKGEIALRVIENDAKLMQFSYEVFHRRNEETNTISNSEMAGLNSYVSILVNATASEIPVFPQPRILIPFGLVAGILLGLSLGFFQEYSDHTIKQAEDVARYFQLPLIFSIPEWEERDEKFKKPKVRPSSTPEKPIKKGSMGVTPSVAVLLLVGVTVLLASLMSWPPFSSNQLNATSIAEPELSGNFLKFSPVLSTVQPDGKRPGLEFEALNEQTLNRNQKVIEDKFFIELVEESIHSF